MPGITIHLDGKHLATINLAGLNVVDVSTHGALDQDPMASLDASGGNYGDTDSSSHWIWVAGIPLHTEQIVRICFVETCEGGDSGKTIQELFPDEEPCTQTDFSITPEMAEEIRARPQLHDRFSVLAETSRGQRAVALSDERNTSFRFGVLWDWTRPNQARVTLGTYCLENILERNLGPHHLDDILSFGDSASFTVLSEPR